MWNGPDGKVFFAEHAPDGRCRHMSAFKFGHMTGGHDEIRLLVGCLDRHETHRRARHRLADRFRVRRICLAAFDVGLYIDGWHHADVVVERFYLPSPEVSTPAGLHTDNARRQFVEEGQNLRSA